MPKTLILFQRPTGTAATIADAVAEGARSVRFSEVEMYTPGDRGADDLSSYDAIIVGLSSSAELASVMGGVGSLPNRVGAAFAADGADGELPWSIMRALAGLDMILVPPARDGSVAAARELGKRVAEVTSWITHARSHHHSH